MQGHTDTLCNGSLGVGVESLKSLKPLKALTTSRASGQQGDEATAHVP